MFTPYTLLRYKGSKKSNLKCEKKVTKKIQDSEKNTCVSTDHPKAHVKFQKDRLKLVGGFERTSCILPIFYCGIGKGKVSHSLIAVGAEGIRVPMYLGHN